MRRALSRSAAGLVVDPERHGVHYLDIDCAYRFERPQLLQRFAFSSVDGFSENEAFQRLATIGVSPMW